MTSCSFYSYMSTDQGRVHVHPQDLSVIDSYSSVVLSALLVVKMRCTA